MVSGNPTTYHLPPDLARQKKSKNQKIRQKSGEQLIFRWSLPASHPLLVFSFYPAIWKIHPQYFVHDFNLARCKKSVWIKLGGQHLSNPQTRILWLRFGTRCPDSRNFAGTLTINRFRQLIVRIPAILKSSHSFPRNLWRTHTLSISKPGTPEGSNF